MILEHLPPGVILALPEIALILIGLVIERHYVSRVTVFGNAMALTAHAITVQDLSPVLTAYVEVGILLGAYGLFKYVREESIGQPYYVVSYYLYSSLPVGLIIFLPAGDVVSFVLATVVHIGMALFAGGVSPFVYSGARPYEVAHFIRNNTIKYPNHEIGRWVKVPLSDVFD